MNVKVWFWVAAAIVGSVMQSSQAATNSTSSSSKKAAPYTCKKDADCEAKFPDTVCIIVDNYGVKVGKCTPNTKERPACRGGQPGLCPSYQDAERGYLNAHCIFVAVDVDSLTEEDSTGTTPAAAAGSGKSSGSGSAAAKSSAGSGKKSTAGSSSKATAGSKSKSGSGSKATTTRMLAADASSKSAVGSSSGGASSTVSSSSSSSSKAAAGSAKNFGKYAVVVVANKTVTGEFVCVDVSDCENQAVDPSTCEPKECGASSANKMQCNNQGTCTFPSIQTMDKRRCMCYKGFQGEKCQQTISNECDVDCGLGGDCVSGECKCKKGYDGKGTGAGKPDARCTKCTSDSACQNGNPCNTENGKCECSSGFFGPTCGATEDGCTKITCGNDGSCQLLANGTGACFCNRCGSDGCTQCETKACLECPSAATGVQVAKSVVLVSVVVAVVLGSW